jgi:hypothetical protein
MNLEKLSYEDLKQKIYTIIKCDINIDIINTNLDCNNYLNLINEYGFINLINFITILK